VQRFHRQLNADDYVDICDEADEAFAQSKQHDQLIRLLDSVHRKLGKAVTVQQLNINVNATLGGTFLTARYTTKFEQADAVETFTWRKSGSTWKLYGYNVQSEAFLK
jgi:hypothetical protein